MIYLLSFILSVISVVILLSPGIQNLPKTVLTKIKNKNKPIKSVIRETKSKGQKNSLKDLEYTLRDFLKRVGKEKLFDFALISSVVLSALSVPLCLVFDNIFLLPFLACLLFSLPFIAILIWKNIYEKKEYSELETAMSLVTSSYLRNPDLTRAFEENNEYLKYPVKDRFVSFSSRIRSIDPDIKKGLRELKRQFPYRIFSEWCDELELCTDDRSKSDMLPRTVSKMTDERIVNLEIAPLLSSARKEFFTMAAMVLLNYPLLSLINKDWFSVMTDTIQGKFVTGLVLLTILFTTFFCFKMTKKVRFGKGDNT